MMFNKKAHLIFSISLAFLGLTIFNQDAKASGLQVSPISLTLDSQKNEDGLWLSNIGSNVVHAQIRVYKWTQDNGLDQLNPSQDLVISPPMTSLDINGKQYVRVIDMNNTPSTNEQAYRLAIDELPIKMVGQRGLQFVLHYSVPIFIQSTASASVNYQLNWKIEKQKDSAIVKVTNTGLVHAQVADLNFIDTQGNEHALSTGLLGYILPGSSVQWDIKKQFVNSITTDGQIEAMINGQTVKQKVEILNSVK